MRDIDVWVSMDPSPILNLGAVLHEQLVDIALLHLMVTSFSFYLLPLG